MEAHANGSNEPILPHDEVVTSVATADAPSLQPQDLTARADNANEEPTMSPPDFLSAGAGGDTGITTWHNGKKVVALWCNSSNRNAFASVPGLGWKRLASQNDSAFLTLTMLASHAEQTDSACNVRIESDGQIQEMYIW